MQGVNIARALIASANLLLPDEPTSALNPESTAVVVKMLREVKRKTTRIGTKTPEDFPGSSTDD